MFYTSNYKCSLESNIWENVEYIHSIILLEYKHVAERNHRKTILSNAIAI